MSNLSPPRPHRHILYRQMLVPARPLIHHRQGQHSLHQRLREAKLFQNFESDLTLNTLTRLEATATAPTLH